MNKRAQHTEARKEDSRTGEDKEHIGRADLYEDRGQSAKDGHKGVGEDGD